MRTQRRNRSGFTLMEVLLVMAILVVMASLVTFAYLTIQKNTSQDAAFNQASLMASACKQFKLNTGRFPQKLEDLIALPQGMNNRQWKGPYLEAQQIPMDPWGNEYMYSFDQANNRVTIISYGPDGVQGGDDDISNNQQ